MQAFIFAAIATFKVVGFGKNQVAILIYVIIYILLKHLIKQFYKDTIPEMFFQMQAVTVQRPDLFGLYMFNRL